MSPLSNVQFSRFTETEVAKILTFGSGGLLEVMVPMTDDERRDIETHLKQKFRLSLAIQVKARHVLFVVTGRTSFRSASMRSVSGWLPILSSGTSSDSWT